MTVNDIRPLKQQMRKKYKSLRTAMSEQEKACCDGKILSKLLNTWAYREQDLILTYVSTAIEVDTYGLIEKALQDGKTVAAPRCVDNTRLMDFYVVRSLDDLESGSFGVMEPKPSRCEKLTDFSQGLCVVPALCFDKAGYRLGYGKGYYDRFLASFGGTTVGICYSNCVCDALPCGKFDKSVDVLVTEKGCVTLSKQRR